MAINDTKKGAALSPDIGGAFEDRGDPAAGAKSRSGSASRSRDDSDSKGKESPSEGEQSKPETPAPGMPKSFLPKAAFSPLAPPTLSVPKGGGAIRGIGETLRTNPATGTAGFDIPLPVTPAPHGTTPQLSLSYGSAQSNGLFGAGFSVDIPRISRRTDKQLPQYRDSEDSDTFVLSGVEDLVPLFDTSGVRDFNSDSTQSVERFRPRTEGLYAWIERVTVFAVGMTPQFVYWRTVSRDHVTSTFGTSAGSRIADPSQPDLVFTWLLDKTVDATGHIVTYDYKAEDFVGVNTALPSESHRRDNRALFANKHIKSVKYGYIDPTNSATYSFEVVFDYGEHDTANPQPGDLGDWSLRQDPFSSYRGGFDLRTYRLCERVLVFHNITPLSSTPVLVRSLNFAYAENAILTKLTTVTLVGYTRATGTTYTSESMPALALSYSEPVFTKTIHTYERTDVQPEFPKQLLGKEAQFLDLDGEGIPGVLTRRGGTLHYQRNLGSGKLGPPRCLAVQPALTSAREAQLTDVAGAGTMALVAWTEAGAGFHERVADGWGPFIAFASQPQVDWTDPNLRLVDLNGDGFADILITRGDHFIWYPSIARQGFGPPQRVAVPSNERLAPRVIFNDPKMSIYLADMTGDGLTDIVRVRWSSISYWPNLGYGRFGAEVRMDKCPQLEGPDRFHTSRIRLADLDGSGTADLLVFTANGMVVYFNGMGNGFSDANLNPYVPLDALHTLTLTDYYGNGTTTVAWSPLGAGNNAAPLRTNQPTGPDKPHLLTEIDNSMGKTTRLAYAPSTAFYLADRLAGKPWATKLPMPVQVIERVETYDAVSRTRLVTTYSYHHGHYDTVEREFRGFGRVEQTDAETFAAEAGLGLFPGRPPPDSHDEEAQAPVLTKTWFHLGVWTNQGSIEAGLATEYWDGDSAHPAHLSCSIPTGLTPEEAREATRALRGTTLRQEVYGLDGSMSEGIPFVVSEQAYDARAVQKKCPGKGPDHALLYGVFDSVPRESRTYEYERVANDPRVHQELALAVDDFAQVTSGASVAYPRRTTSTYAEQNALLIAVAERDLYNALHTSATTYRIGVETEARVSELTGVTPASTFFTASELASAFSGATGIAYEVAPTTGAQKRLVERVKTQYYDSTSLPSVLAFGTSDALALVYQSYRLDLTDGLLTAIFAARVTGTMLTEGAYVTPSGESGYWVPSGFATFDATHYFLPTSFTDPFGKTTTLAYDTPLFLAVVSVTDPVSNVVAATPDYRVMAPSLVTDPNGNQSDVAFDDLGRVVAMAVMGKSGEGIGDTLAHPTVAYTYELDRFSTSGKANRVHVLAREKHYSDATTPNFQESYVYSDGSGRVVMTKTKVEPGDAPERDGSGALIFDGGGHLVVGPADPRWVGSGKTVLNNKGNPVKQYEPFFSATFELDTEDELVQWGVTPLLTYDAIGRVVRLDLPNGSYRMSTWDAWSQTAFDENDTSHMGTGSLWRAARQSGATPTPSAAEQRASTLTDAHVDTPATTFFDSMGRPFLVQADNGGTVFQTRSKLDIEGQVLSVTDALTRVCETRAYSIGGTLLKTHNIDAGDRYMLDDVGEQPIRRWDSRGQIFRLVYDDVRRNLEHWVDPGSGETLALKRVYGEGATSDTTLNLRGKLIKEYDEAGRVEHSHYDFKGNLLSSTRRFLTTPTALPDYQTSPDSLLASETFTTSATFDALNRVTTQTTPDTSITTPSYNQAGLLESVSVNVRGSGTATAIVSTIDYDAHGRRTQIAYTNGTSTAYTYEPLTFRLATLVTTRTSDSATIQSLTYTFDPVGNVVQIVDGALQTLLFTHTVEDPSTKYEYDATYRLTYSEGRENAANARPPQSTDLLGSAGVPDSNTGATARFTETYAYDAVSNVSTVTHTMVGNPSGNWTRRYEYGDGSTNRLNSTDMPGDTTAPYSNLNAYDVHGNTTSMSTPSLSSIGYSPFDQMVTANLGGGGNAYYGYDAGGQRVHKWIDTGASLIKERIYLGGYEVFRQIVAGTVMLERQTLHVMDGVKRVAMIETKTNDSGVISSPTPIYRFQLGNHLDSALVELDAAGNVFSYEEYFAYGGTAYRSGENGVDVSAKRYRYCGAERDDETGFYCMGARYYCPWLGRWTTADPLGLQAGINLYLYCRAGPVVFSDPSGLDEDQPTSIAQKGWNLVKAPFEGGASSAPTRTGETQSIPLDKVITGDVSALDYFQNPKAIEAAALDRGGGGPVEVSSDPHSPTVGAPGEKDDFNPFPAVTNFFKPGPATATVEGKDFLGDDVPKGYSYSYRFENKNAVQFAQLALSVLPGLEEFALGEKPPIPEVDTSRVGVGPRFDPAKLERIQANLEKQGVTFKYDPEALKAAGAEATYTVPPKGGPGTITLHPEPSRASVIEELLHLGQHRQAGFPGARVWDSSRVAREMQAQTQLHNLGLFSQEEKASFREAWKFWQRFQGQ